MAFTLTSDPYDTWCAHCREIINHLNWRTGRTFGRGGPTKSKETWRVVHNTHVRYGDNGINACKSVINWLHDGWAHREEMAHQLVPDVIFRKSKFDMRWEKILAGAPPPGREK